MRAGGRLFDERALGRDAVVGVEEPDDRRGADGRAQQFDAARFGQAVVRPQRHGLDQIESKALVRFVGRERVGGRRDRAGRRGRHRGAGAAEQQAFQEIGALHRVAPLVITVLIRASPS